MIIEKGTTNVFNKLFDVLSADDTESLTFNEEWAVRVGNYGAVASYNEIEFVLDESKFKLNPQPFELTSTIDPNVVDFVYRQLPTDIYVKPVGYSNNIWSTNDTISYLRTPGYVRYEDTRASIDSLTDIITTDISSFVEGDYVWTAFEGREWNIYRFTIAEFKVEANKRGIYPTIEVIGINRTINPKLQGNVISTEVSNSPIEIRPNGTGNIQLQGNTNITGNLNVTGNVSATGSITIGGNIIIGDESTDTITINASIRSDLIPEVDNLYDIGDPTYRWNDIYVNNFYTTAINIPTLDIGNLIFRNNEITSTTGQDINILAAGTGGVRFANFRFSNNTITNVVSGAVSIFEQTDLGYFKIATTNGFVPPVGNDAQRPTAYAVVGMTRYNTQSRALEIWDGFAWASPAGSGGAVSANQANDIAAAFALTLG
jgi:hypothetical protein